MVYTCPPELIGTQSTSLGTREFPTCDAGAGLWLHVNDLPSSFAFSTTLGLSEVAALLTAAAIALAVAWGFRLLFDFTKNR
jgi:hypothetical protein